MSRSQIRSGALLSYAAIAVGLFTTLFLTPWLIDTLGVSQYGLYTLALSLIGLFTVDFGLAEASARFFSKFKAEKDAEGLGTFARLLLVLYIGLDVVIGIGFLVLYFFLPDVYRGLSFGELQDFRGAYVVIAAATVLCFPFVPLDGLLIANEKFVSLRGVELAQKLLTAGLSFSFVAAGWGLGGLVLAVALSNFAAAAGKLLLSLRLIPPPPEKKGRWQQLFKEVVAFTGWIGLAGIMQKLVISVMPTILGSLSDASQIAVFGIGASIEGYVYTVAAALNGLFLPTITRFAKGPDGRSKTVALMVRIGRLQLAVIGVIVVLWVSLGQQFISLWVGGALDGAYWGALLMIAPAIISLPQQLGRTAVVAGGAVRPMAYVYAVMAGGSVLSAWLLVPRFGALGAAGAVFVAYSLKNVGMNLVYVRDLGLDMRLFFKETYSRLAAVLLAMVCIAAVARLHIPASWTGLVVGALVIGTPTVAVVWTVGLTAEERRQILRK